MKSLVILFVIAAIASYINCQSTTPSTGAVGATLPPALLTLVQNLQKDVLQMQTSGTWDAKKIGAQLQVISNSVQSSVNAASPAVQDQFKQLQTKVQALSTGTPDNQAIKQTIHQSFMLVETLYPGSKQAIHPNAGNARATPPPPTPASG